MIATGISKEQLEQAAASINVAVDVRPTSGSGRRHRVKVNPLVPSTCYTPSGARKRGEAGNAPYQRISWQANGRRCHAVCWHGFRDFFRACFALAPEATFRTAMDTWKGRDDFEARFAASGHRNVGSQSAPMCAAEACVCGEEGYAG